MKYTSAFLLVLAGFGEAQPMPSAWGSWISGLGNGAGSSIGTGSSIGSGIESGSEFGPGTGTGSGSGFSLPSFGSGFGSSPSATSAASVAAPMPIPASPSNRSGSIGGNCTSQSSGSGGGFGFGGSSTESGVKDKTCCTDVTVIFARGTGETGNVGTVTGPPMFKSLRQKLGDGKVTIQGVDYPADAAGNANLGASGGPTMASLVKTAKSQCPNSKVILSGYSQGAMVVHNALRQGVSGSEVTGAVLFGDPRKTQSVGNLGQDEVKEFCASQDTICGTGNDLQGSHLSYGSVADQAADWVIKTAGLT